MWLVAKRDYVSPRTNKRIITEGKQYRIISERKRANEVTIESDSKRAIVPRDVFIEEA